MGTWWCSDKLCHLLCGSLHVLYVSAWVTLILRTSYHTKVKYMIRFLLHLMCELLKVHDLIHGHDVKLCFTARLCLYYSSHVVKFDRGTAHTARQSTSRASAGLLIFIL